MAYNVVITPPAKRRLEAYVGYTATELKNPKAAKDILIDASLTKKRLSEIAGSIKVIDNPILSKYAYRKILFQNHRFVMIYRIDNNTVIVEGMYHELQDYESTFIHDKKLS